MRHLALHVQLRLKQCMSFFIAGTITATTENKDLKMTLTLLFMSFFFIVTTTTTGTYHIGKLLYNTDAKMHIKIVRF